MIRRILDNPVYLRFVCFIHGHRPIKRPAPGVGWLSFCGNSDSPEYELDLCDRCGAVYVTKQRTCNYTSTPWEEPEA